MSQTVDSPRARQLVDWSSAIWAGLIGGTVFLIVNLLLSPILLGGNAWVQIRLLASIVMGPEILAPPATFDAGALVAALISHYALSVGFALVVAYVIHRGGLIAGMIGGAALGLFLYAINFYTLTYFFPQFFPMRGGAMLLSHLIFGAVVVASGSSSSEMLANAVASMVNMKYGREDELQSDELGVKFMSDAGYDPRAMIEVQRILEAEAGGGAPPEFMSTHPSAPNRIQVIEETIAEIYPNGVPAVLIP